MDSNQLGIMTVTHRDPNEIPKDPADWTNAHVMRVCLFRLVKEGILDEDVIGFIGGPEKAEPIHDADGEFLDDNSYYVPFTDERVLDALYDNDHLAYSRLEEIFEGKLYFICELDEDTRYEN